MSITASLPCHLFSREEGAVTGNQEPVSLDVFQSKLNENEGGLVWALVSIN